MKIDSVISRYAFALLMFWSAAPSAYTLSFDPSNLNVELNSKAYVDVTVDGVLPNGLGSYDFDVLFDPTIFAFDQAIDKLGLGAAFGLDASLGSGKVTLSNFSFEAPADLLNLQSNNFTLLTLVFDTVSLGTGGLNFDLISLGDAIGAPVNVTAASTASFTVSPVQVPEPGSMSLFLLGGIAAVVFRQGAVRTAGRNASKDGLIQYMANR